MSKLPPLRCFRNLHKHLILQKRNRPFTADLLAKYMYYIYSREKLDSQANLGYLTQCQQRVNVLMPCTKVRIQMSFPSIPVGWPHDRAPFSIMYRDSYLPSSQPVVPCVTGSWARRREGAKPSNREVSDLEIKTKLYSCRQAQLFNQTELPHSLTIFSLKGEDGCTICIHTSNAVLSPHAVETPLLTERLPLPFSLFQDFYSKSPAHLEQ